MSEDESSLGNFDSVWANLNKANTCHATGTCHGTDAAVNVTAGADKVVPVWNQLSTSTACTNAACASTSTVTNKSKVASLLPPKPDFSRLLDGEMKKCMETFLEKCPVDRYRD